jgi:hypothetical protein
LPTAASVLPDEAPLTTCTNMQPARPANICFMNPPPKCPCNWFGTSTKMICPNCPEVITRPRSVQTVMRSHNLLPAVEAIEQALPIPSRLPIHHPNPDLFHALKCAQHPSVADRAGLPITGPCEGLLPPCALRVNVLFSTVAKLLASRHTCPSLWRHAPRRTMRTFASRFSFLSILPPHQVRAS